MVTLQAMVELRKARNLVTISERRYDTYDGKIYWSLFLSVAKLWAQRGSQFDCLHRFAQVVEAYAQNRSLVNQLPIVLNKFIHYLQAIDSQEHSVKPEHQSRSFRSQRHLTSTDDSFMQRSGNSLNS